MSTSISAPPAKQKQFQTLSGHWLTGNFRGILSSPLHIYQQAWQECGDWARIRILPGVYLYLLSHPDGIEHVLQSNHRNYRKPDMFNRPAGLLLGKSVVTTEGERWRQQRKNAQPAFTQVAIQRLASQMVQVTEEYLEQLERASGEVIEIQEPMMQLTLRIAGLTLMNRDLNSQLAELSWAYRVAFAMVGRRMNPQIIPMWWPTKKHREFRRARKLLDQVVRQSIVERRSMTDWPEDFLSQMIRTHDVSEPREEEQQLVDDVVSMLGASHETIGATLTWAWYLLGKHPEIQEQVAEEIRGQLQGRSPTSEDLNALSLTRGVIQESMRLYPPAWGQPRESIEAEDIQGYPIPKKAMIVVSQYLTHRHPEFWDQPNEFRPERFLESTHRPKFAYFPFGGGPRICIGNTFAMQEGQMVLATILQRFRVELVSQEEPEYDLTFSLRPKHDLNVIFRRR